MVREIRINEKKYINFEGLERLATKIIAKAMDILRVYMIDIKSILTKTRGKKADKNKSFRGYSSKINKKNREIRK